MFGYDWASGFIAPFADRDGVPFATPSDAVEAILDIVLSARNGVVASPSLMDLGSGDGRIVLAAARRGVRAVGVELDSGLVAAARAAAAAEGLDCCSFEETTVLEVAPASDTRLVAYLLPAGLSKVAARLKAAGFCGLFFTIRWAVSQSATT